MKWKQKCVIRYSFRYTNKYGEKMELTDGRWKIENWRKIAKDVAKMSSLNAARECSSPYLYSYGSQTSTSIHLADWL